MIGIARKCKVNWKISNDISYSKILKTLGKNSIEVLFKNNILFIEEN
jgi:hypothetical protein